MAFPLPSEPAVQIIPKGYPRLLDDVVVRLVAGQVLIVAVVAAATGQLWLFLPLALDFAVRTLVGPKASPLAWLARRIRPRLNAPARFVPSPPKRFAMALGMVFSLAIGVLSFTGPATLAWLLVGVMILFPALESLAGICVGCQVFSALMRLGVIPESVCLECADLSRRARAR